jgi:uncharacterized protein YbjT (DUF2867 family)
MGKLAIILGATGLTGGQLLNYVLSDSYYEKVLVFGRRPLGINHPKLEEHILDLFQLRNKEEIFKSDVVFCCVGTTKAKTPNKATYKDIDYGIPVAAAELSKKNNIQCFVVMSSLGANANSPIFYNRIKGEMELAVLALEIPQTYVLQPSLIMGKRNEFRLGEALFKGLMHFINPLLIGQFRRYQSIQSTTLALAMAVLPKSIRLSGIIPSNIIKDIANHGN